jgi:hypothetical protein
MIALLASRPLRRRNFAAIEIGRQLIRVGQGTPITERPPHRTVRAVFPHTAPTLGV